MDKEQRLMYVRGRLLQAEINMQAMIAANRMRELNNESPAYNESAFMKLIEDFGVHHNALIQDLGNDM